MSARSPSARIPARMPDPTNDSRRRFVVDSVQVAVVAGILWAGVNLASRVGDDTPLDPRFVDDVWKAVAPLPAIAPGRSLSTRGGPDQRGYSVVLITSPACGACLASTPVLQRIYRTSRGLAVRFVVAVPDIERSRSYLRESGLGGSKTVDWRDLTLSPLGTPTIALVDPNGVVQRTWLGPFDSAESEADLLSALRSPAEVRPPTRRLSSGERILTLDEAKRLAASTAKTFTVVDTRKRDQFAVEHLPGSINIPMSELQARALFELDPEHFNALDCSLLSDSRCSLVVRELRFLRIEIVAIDALEGYPKP